jgi:lysophospholipase L1-like esterase
VAGAGRRTQNDDAALPKHSGRARRLVGGLLVGLFTLELGLRLALGNFAQSALLQRSEDPEVCLELKPGVELTYTGWLARVKPSTMRVNTHGARGPEIPVARKPGSLRIAALGDSFTFGQGVEEEETFVAALGRRLAIEKIPNEILNFGVPGHGTPQAVAHVRKDVLWTQPDVVLLHVFANDLSAEDSYCTFGQGGNAASAWTLRNVYSARLLYIGLGPLRQRPQPELAERLGTPGERFKKAVAELAALAQRNGFLPAVVILTDRETFAQSSYCRSCEAPHDLVKDSGLFVADMSATWRELQKDIPGNFIPRDDHLSVAGNELMGDAIAAKLLAWPELRGRAGVE